MGFAPCYGTFFRNGMTENKGFFHSLANFTATDKGRLKAASGRRIGILYVGGTPLREEAVRPLNPKPSSLPLVSFFRSRITDCETGNHILLEMVFLILRTYIYVFVNSSVLAFYEHLKIPL